MTKSWDFHEMLNGRREGKRRREPGNIVPAKRHEKAGTRRKLSHRSRLKLVRELGDESDKIVDAGNRRHWELDLEKPIVAIEIRVRVLTTTDDNTVDHGRIGLLVRANPESQESRVSLLGNERRKLAARADQSLIYGIDKRRRKIEIGEACRPVRPSGGNIQIVQGDGID